MPLQPTYRPGAAAHHGRTRHAAPLPRRDALRWAQYIAPLLLAACSSGPLGDDGPSAPTAPGAIAFAPTEATASGAAGGASGSGGSSRAASVEAVAQLRGETLAVSAYRCHPSGATADWTAAEWAAAANWTMADEAVFANQQLHVDAADVSLVTYSPPAYWPFSDTKVRFFAWWPHSDVYSAPITIGADCQPLDAPSTGLHPALVARDPAPTDGSDPYELRLPYAVGPSATSQPDLLLSNPTEPINNVYDYTTLDADGLPAAVAAAPAKVPLSFVHALARVRFKVCFPTAAAAGITDATEAAAYGRYTVSVDSVELRAISEGVATFRSKTYYYANAGSKTSGDLFPAWETNRIVKYEYDEEQQRNVIVSAPATGRWVLTPGAGLPLTTDSTTTLQPGTTTAYDAAYDLFMIPQRPPKFDTFRPTQLYMPIISIAYRLDNGLLSQTKDGATADASGQPYGADNPSPDWLYTDKLVSISLTDVLCQQQLGSDYSSQVLGQDDDPYVWLPGKSYLYTINITTTDVTLNITPTDWIDGNGGNDQYVFK